VCPVTDNEDLNMHGKDLNLQLLLARSELVKTL